MLPAPRWLPLLVFAAVFVVLHRLTIHLRGSGWEPVLIDLLTVAPAAQVIGAFFPEDGVAAQGARLVWPGGRLGLVNGCDGFEVMTLFAAAMLAAPLTWRRGAPWLIGGVACLWATNQLRIAALYGAWRHQSGWFDAIHTVWSPLLLIGVAVLVFAAALRHERSG